MKVHHLSIQCSIYPMDLIYRSLAIDNSVLDSQGCLVGQVVIKLHCILWRGCKVISPGVMAINCYLQLLHQPPYLCFPYREKNACTLYQLSLTMSTTINTLPANNFSSTLNPKMHTKLVYKILHNNYKQFLCCSHDISYPQMLPTIPTTCAQSHITSHLNS